MIKNEPSAEVRLWLGEITDAKEREKDFRKNGREVIEIYAGDKPDDIPFVIYVVLRSCPPKAVNKSTSEH